MYPPGKDVNVDMTKYKGLEISEELDVLVSPSMLAPFIKARAAVHALGRPSLYRAGHRRLPGGEPVARDQV